MPSWKAVCEWSKRALQGLGQLRVVPDGKLQVERRGETKESPSVALHGRRVTERGEGVRVDLVERVGHFRYRWLQTSLLVALWAEGATRHQD